MTNTTKALIISAINAGIGLAVAFGVDISDKQQGAVIVFANTIGALAVALTYKSSPKRIPDDAIGVIGQ
jgi:hypothetical protein